MTLARGLDVNNLIQHNETTVLTLFLIPSRRLCTVFFAQSSDELASTSSDSFASHGET